MADIKPKPIKDMTPEERVELAARYAMESYTDVIFKDDFLTKLSKSDPKTFANLVKELLKLQLENEKIKATQTQAQQSNNAPAININFVEPRKTDD